MKKLFKIFLIIIGILTVAIGLYSTWIYFISPASKDVVSTPPDTAVQVSPTEYLQILSSQTVFDYWLKNNEIYFVSLTGKIYRTSFSGKEESILNQTVENLSSVRPSADGSKAIISFGYPSKEIFAIFNTADKNWQPLPAEITAATWNPRDPNQLAVLRQAENQTAISIYSLSVKKFNDLLVLNQQDLKIDWAAPDEIYLTDRPTNKAGGFIWAVHIIKKTVRPVIQNEPGLIVKWFNNGQKGLKFSRKQNANILEVIDRNNQTQTILPIISLPEKCAVDETDIYCGGSENFRAASLPDDYLKDKRFAADILYHMPKGAEEISLSIYDSSIERTPLDIFRPEIKKGRLILINRLDRKLYLLDLNL